MKVIVDIPENKFKDHGSIDLYYMAGALANGMLIPDDATNGDMVKAMFPYGKYGTNGDWVHVYGVGGNGCLTFTLNWWNAPYKKGDKE